jgi:hypothetical protein
MEILDRAIKGESLNAKEKEELTKHLSQYDGTPYLQEILNKIPSLKYIELPEIPL